jgi:hypothetical protein
LQAATVRAFELEARVAESTEAVARAEAAAEAGRHPGDAPVTAGTDDERVAALEAEVLHLENRLEQTELRARHAYAEAENAQAELRFARERGDAPQSAGEDGRLRSELTAALQRVQSAEEKTAALRAELLLAKKGVPTEIDPEPTNGYVADEAEDEGVSLRTRLSRAVDSKRATGEDDTRQWR